MKGITLELKDITDSREILESREAPGIRYFIYILTGIIILAVVFACVFEIDEYTRIYGEIKTYSTSSQIASGSSGRIESVMVTEGQQVKKGDILFMMDSGYYVSQRNILSNSLKEYTAKLANTEKLKESIIQGKNLFDKSDEYYYRYEQYLNTVELSENEVERALQSEESTSKEKNSTLEYYQDSISQKKQQISEYNCIIECILYDYQYAGTNSSSKAMMSEYNFQLDKLKVTTEGYKSVYEYTKNAYEHAEKINIESEAMILSGSVENIVSSDNTVVSLQDVENAEIAYKNALSDEEQLKNSWVTDINAKIDTLNTEIKSLEKNSKSISASDSIKESLDEYKLISSDKIKNESLISMNSEISTLEEKIESCKSQLLEIDESIRNTEIKAELDGTVTLVSQFNKGDIVQTGQQLCTLLSEDDRLKVYLYIPENEISKINPGQKTEYVFDALPYNQYGKISGEIISVSEDSITNELTGAKYYLAEANLSALSLTNNKGEKREIKNGMLTEAKVISGSEKAIYWLLRKINLKD